MPLIKQGYIPLDKSWFIRMGVLDLLHGRKDTLRFLNTQRELGEDLLTLGRALRSWEGGGLVDVGESGTLHRFLQFTSWKFHLNKEFLRRGTLEHRTLTQNPDIVHWSLRELLTLDHGTSQWASAAVLCGRSEIIPNPPYKLALTYEAVSEWSEARRTGGTWKLRHDTTILRQAEVFLSFLRGEQPSFLPKHSEDYCFARAFDFITQEEGERRWPSVRGHESDRITEMENTLYATEAGRKVTSRDHRVVQAIAMWVKLKKRDVHIRYPEAVNKSWPQFWQFLRNVEVLAAETLITRDA